MILLYSTSVNFSTPRSFSMLSGFRVLGISLVGLLVSTSAVCWKALTRNVRKVTPLENRQSNTIAWTNIDLTCDFIREIKSPLKWIKSKNVYCVFLGMVTIYFVFADVRYWSGRSWLPASQWYTSCSVIQTGCSTCHNISSIVLLPVSRSHGCWTLHLCSFNVGMFDWLLVETIFSSRDGNIFIYWASYQSSHL